MQYSNIPSALRTIAVTGNGEISASPNYAQIQLEVNTEGISVSEAQQENAKIMNQVIQSILALHIPRENIQTTAYNIFPSYDFIEGKQVFRGYEVTNAITVQIADVSQVGAVIDTAVRNGANRVSTIQFRVENPDVYYQQALRLALQNAQTKAKTIAETMQLPLQAQPIEIVEEYEANPVLFKSVAMSNQTPIEQGEISIQATVRVKFQY